jgi:hypothetical protein
MKYRSICSYGGPGHGKTFFGVSAFWNPLTNEPVPGTNGKLILVGREDNQDLGLPDEMVRRFPLDPDHPMQFAKELQEYLKMVSLAARQGHQNKLTTLCIDGISELCYAFIWAAKQEPEAASNQFWAWNEWQQQFVAIMQMLNPNTLQADVFATARVAEYREGSSKVKGDPDWMESFRYFPAAQGWARMNVGHYFNYIVFHNQGFDKQVVKGTDGKNTTIKIPYVKTHWLPTGDYLVKNVLQHKWLLSGMPAEMKNVQWPEVKAAMDAIDDGLTITVRDGIPYPVEALTEIS